MTCSGWSIFLDRDGVINKRLIDDYVKSYDEFEFLPGVPEALAVINQQFPRVFIITNQRGIARALMTQADLALIHAKMLTDLQSNGAALTAIYFCPHDRHDHCDCRKPKPGMALQAKADYPDVDFLRSIMVGDSIHDLEVGRQLGMKTVFISEVSQPPPQADYIFSSLRAFSEKIKIICKE